MNLIHVTWPAAATIVVVCQLIGIVLRLVTEWLALHRAVLDRKADQRKKLREKGRPRHPAKPPDDDEAQQASREQRGKQVANAGGRSREGPAARPFAVARVDN